MIQATNPTLMEIALIVNDFYPGRVDLLRKVLINHGIDDREIIESRERPYCKLAFYLKNGNRARRLARKLKGLRLRDVRVMSRVLHRKDWATKWKEHFKPFILTPTFGVVPLWRRSTHKLKCKIPVYIDTDLAFGTGLHPTTRYMAGFIEKVRGRFQDVWDVGTGTGILSIVAAKCGAQTVEALDINPDAVRVARKNCRANGCPKVHIKVADAHRVRSLKKYDLVCANIITQDIIALADKLVKAVKPGKFLAVSGISMVSYDFFRERYARYPLKCLKARRGDGWTAVLFQRRPW